MSRLQGHEADDSDYGVTLDVYARVMKRYWWVIVLVVVATTVAAFVLSSSQPDRYRADAKLLYIGTLTDPTALTLELNAVNSTITSADLEARAAPRVGRPLPKDADFTVSAAPVAMTAEGGSVGPLNPTRLVAVTAEAGDATLATQLANAYANAFVQSRTQATRNGARASVKVIRNQIAALREPNARATATYVSLIQRLGDLEFTATQGNGGYSVLVAAVPPTEPFSPQPVSSAILGLVVGLVLAIILALLLHRFGTRLDDAREVATLLRLPILGQLSRSRDERLDTGRLVTLEAPASSAAEAYRRLRASLSAALVGDDVKTLLFASACEGEGTSAALANVAVALARTGRGVVVVDADLRSPSLHEYFGLPNDDGVTSVVTGRMSLSTALHPVDIALEGESVSGPEAAAVEGPLASLKVLTSGPNVLDPGELVAGQAMAAIVADLKGSADIVLVDSPGLLDAADANSLASVVDGLIFVVDARVTSRPALQECKEYLALVPCRQLGMVFMQESRRHTRRGRGRAKHAPAVTPEATEPAAHTASVSPGG